MKFPLIIGWGEGGQESTDVNVMGVPEAAQGEEYAEESSLNRDPPTGNLEIRTSERQLLSAYTMTEGDRRGRIMIKGTFAVT